MRIEYDPPRARDSGDGRLGYCCFSVDYDHFTHVEGTDDSESVKTKPLESKDRLDLNSEGTRILVELADRYEIPITWAICGKTALADKYSFSRILGAKTRHEIALHTFSHIDVSHCSALELKQEINECVKALKVNNREETPTTFIFPWNKVGHFETLHDLGFRTYRGKRRTIGLPKMNGAGLLDIPPVYYLDTHSRGAFPLVRRFVDFCLWKGAVFHLWTHPWGIVERDDTEALARETIEPLFRYLSAKKQSGVLELKTMSELAPPLGFPQIS